MKKLGNEILLYLENLFMEIDQKRVKLILQDWPKIIWGNYTGKYSNT